MRLIASVVAFVATIALLPSTSAEGFHIFTGHCRERDWESSGDPAGPPTNWVTTYYSEVRLVPYQNYNCDYFLGGGGQTGTESMPDNYLPVRGFCGYDIDLRKQSSADKWDVWQHNTANKLGECFRLADSFTCAHRVLFYELSCQWTRTYTCQARVC